MSPHHIVESISFRGGYLDGVTLDLANEINCIIGPPGAGKTTCIEGVRYALEADATRRLEERALRDERPATWLRDLLAPRRRGTTVTMTIPAKQSGRGR